MAPRQTQRCVIKEHPGEAGIIPLTDYNGEQGRGGHFHTCSVRVRDKQKREIRDIVPEVRAEHKEKRSVDLREDLVMLRGDGARRSKNAGLRASG